MHPKDRLLRRYSARLLSIGYRVLLEESRRELLECGHLLRRLMFEFWTVRQQMPVTGLGSPLGSRPGRPGRLTALPIPPAVRQPEANVRLPATVSIRSDCHPRTLYPSG